MFAVKPVWRTIGLSIPLILAFACNGDPTDSTDDTDVEEVDADDDGSPASEDCDDDNPDIYPGAPEEDCEDPVDYNCDGETPLYADADNDGFAECVDCRDDVAAINPGADEICDLLDNDCDNLIDDADDSVTDQDTWYQDSDRDGFGNPDVSQMSCGEPTDYVADNTDCDDTERKNYPGNTEVCDEVDNDCDELVDDADDSVTGQTQWFADADEDELGDAETSQLACSMPEGFVENDLDCDDADKEAGEAGEWYLDADVDGFGLASARRVACDQPTGYVADDTDCNDSDKEINPSADEICDRKDNDCDRLTDDADSDVVDGTDWYPDTDGDDFGDEDATPKTQCVAPAAHVDDDTDCDDTNKAINPDMPFDFDDDEDNDCDTSIDEDVGSETYTHDDDIQPIWNSNCTSCHSFLTSSAHSSIVSKASGLSGYDYVDPGLPDDSYIFRKIEGTHASIGGSGTQMPRSRALSSADQAKIETWIEEGAVK